MLQLFNCAQDCICLVYIKQMCMCVCPLHLFSILFSAQGHVPLCPSHLNYTSDLLVVPESIVSTAIEKHFAYLCFPSIWFSV